jgi:hypothetical protein
MIAGFQLIPTITWYLAYGCGQQQNEQDKKYTSNAGDFDHHVDVVMRCGVHCTMENISIFIRSHWMPPMGECPRHIALAAAMVNKFVETTQNTNKSQL